MGRRVEKYEVVVYSKKDADGNVTVLGEAKFNDYDDADLYRRTFKRASTRVGSTIMYHPGSDRSDNIDKQLAQMVGRL